MRKARAGVPRGGGRPALIPRSGLFPLLLGEILLDLRFSAEGLHRPVSDESGERDPFLPVA